MMNDNGPADQAIQHSLVTVASTICDMYKPLPIDVGSVADMRGSIQANCVNRRHKRTVLQSPTAYHILFIVCLLSQPKEAFPATTFFRPAVQ